MQKLKILIFIDWFTPGYKAGGPVSSNVNLIAHLKGDYHFKVVTRNTEYMETEPYPGIKANQWERMEGFEGYYISNSKLSVSTIRNLIRNISFDIAYVNGIYSPFFSILPLFFLKLHKKKVIVSARGMLSPHALAVKSFKKNFFLNSCKFLGLYKNVCFHATNKEEAGYIRQVMGKDCRIAIAPNLPKPTASKILMVIKEPGHLNIIFIGRIAPEKNTLYAIEILNSLDKITDKKQEINFHIYGSVYNQPYWEQCKNLIANLPEHIKVIYHGTVEPSQIPEVLKQSHFLFQPSKGENYGHTIAESFQNAVPVIISDRTPWRNLEEVESIKYKVSSTKEQVRSNEYEVSSTEEVQCNKYQVSSTKIQDETNTNDGKGVGWDIPLEQPERFVEVIEYCAAMGQEEYNAMSQRAFEYARKVTEDPEVLEANRRLFS